MPSILFFRRRVLPFLFGTSRPRLELLAPVLQGHRRARATSELLPVVSRCPEVWSSCPRASPRHVSTRPVQYFIFVARSPRSPPVELPSTHAPNLSTTENSAQLRNLAFLTKPICLDQSRNRTRLRFSLPFAIRTATCRGDGSTCIPLGNCREAVCLAKVKGDVREMQIINFMLWLWSALAAGPELAVLWFITEVSTFWLRCQSDAPVDSDTRNKLSGISFDSAGATANLYPTAQVSESV